MGYSLRPCGLKPPASGRWQAKACPPFPVFYRCGAGFGYNDRLPATRAGFRLESAPMLEACAMSDIGCVRRNNEDYCLIEPEAGTVRSGGRNGRRQSGRARIAAGCRYRCREMVQSAAARDSQVLLVRGGRGQPARAGGGASDPDWKAWAPRWWRRWSWTTGFDIASVGDSRAYLLDDERLPRDHRRPDLGQRSGPAAGPGRREPAHASHAPCSDHGHRGERGRSTINYYPHPPADPASGADVQRWAAWRGGSGQIEQILQRDATESWRKSAPIDRGRQSRGRPRQRHRRFGEKIGLTEPQSRHG